MDSLGDRIKKYEQVTCGTLCKRMPVMIRVDGRAFHTFTQGSDKPFDSCIMDAMVKSAIEVAKDMQGFKIAYVQSDEATFVITDYNSINTEGWFCYKLNKIVSLSAALMTAYFNKYYTKSSRLACFDSRAFNVPKEDIANAILWRMQDWERNSLQMYCQSLFSHKQLHGKNKAAMHEMLHSSGKNWTTDLTPQQRNGTLITKKDGSLIIFYDCLPCYKDVSEIVDPLIQVKGL